MKSKKIISFLCAAAMTASTFVGMVSTASAATTTLWSDTFDSYSNSVDHFTNVAAVGQVLVDGTSVAKNEYAGIEGVTLITTDRADDSSYFKVTDDEGVGKALTTTVSRFSNASRGAQIVFDETYAPASGSDLVLAFKVYVENLGETTFDEAIQLNGDNTQEIKFVDDLGIALGEWEDVKVVITTSGTSVYVGDSTTAAKTLTATSLSSIKLNGLVDGVSDDTSSGAQKASTSHPLGYPTISFDNMVVYTTSAGEGATAETPEAETKGEVEITYETVPAGEAPEGLGVVASDNLNNNTTERLVFINTTEADSTYSGLNSVILSCGTDTSTHSETKWEVIGNAKTDPALGTEKYLKATSSTKSAANRGPKMEFKKGEIAERETVVAQFATRLHASDSSPAEVIFSGDLVASSDKGNLASPLAMITTDATADSAVYAVNNALEKGGANVIEVPDNKWVVVTIEAYRSEGKTAGAKISVDVDGTTTYIFGSADSYSDLRDNTKSGINTLPYVSFRSGNSTDYYGEGSGSDTVNDIDNIAVYSSNAEAPTPTPEVTPTPQPKHNVTIAYANGTATVSTEESEAFDGVLVSAQYSSNGTLVSAKSYPLTGISASAAKTQAVGTLADGDKLMVWNSVKGMIPYGSYTVSGTGVTQPTDKPLPTEVPAEPTAEPVVEQTTAPGATDKPVDPVTPTAEPVVEPTAAPTLAPGTLYVEDVKALASGQITTKETSTDAEKIADHNVADFGTGTANVTAIPALDGWGYRHYGYAAALTEARQSNGSVDAAKNAVIANGVGNSGCNAAVSFIPANCASITLPASGTIVYTFDAVVTGATQATVSSGTVDRPVTLGITSAADGASVTSVASTTIMTLEATSVPMVITYSLDTKAYTISKDGEVVASGVSETVPTGIYAQVSEAYVGVGIANLVVTVAENDPVLTVTAPAEADGTLTADKLAVKKGDTITITATAKPGRKLTAVKANGEALTAESDGTYKYTIDGDVTITAEYDRADIAAIAITEAPSTIQTGRTAAFTAKVYADAEKTIELALKDGETVTWTVTPATGTTLDADTKFTAASTGLTGTLEVAKTQQDGKITVKAAIGTIESAATDEIELSNTTVSNITVDEEIVGGTINVAPQAKEGQVVTVELVPDAGYKYKAESFKVEKAPEATAAPTAAPTNEPNAGTLSVSPYDVNDAEATAAPTAEPTKAPLPTNAPDEGTQTVTFTMPGYDVIVTAEFEKIGYAITDATADDANGTISFKVDGETVTAAKGGDVVTIVAEPAADYLFNTAVVETTYASANEEIEVTNNTFTMPNEPVTVAASFVSAKYYEDDYSGFSALLGAETSAVLIAGVHGDTAPDPVTSVTGLTITAGNAPNNAYVTSNKVSLVKESDEYYLKAESGRAATVGRGAAIKINNEAVGQSKYTILELDAAITSGGINLSGDSSGNPPKTDLGVGVTNGIAAGERANIKVILGTNAAYVVVKNADNKLYVTDITANGLTKLDGLYFFIGDSSANIYSMSLYGTNDELIYPAEITVTDGAEPLAGATVTVAGQTLTADAEGKVTAKLAAGTYDVTASVFGYNAPQTAPTLTVGADSENKATVTMTTKDIKNVTFSVTPNTATYDVVVKYGNTVIEPKQDKSYDLYYGYDYTYTVTPTGDSASSYDPVTNGTITSVNADTVTPIEVTLPVKTYTVTFTNIPQYAKITIGETITYTDAEGKVDGNDFAVSGVAANGTVSYKIEKGGYTTIDTTTAAITADTSIDAAMTPTTAGTLFYEDFTTTNLSNGATTLFGNQRYNNNKLQIWGNTDVTLNGVSGKDGYEITLGGVSTYVTNNNRDRTKTITFKDTAGNTLFSMTTGRSGADLITPTITVGTNAAAEVANFVSGKDIVININNGKVTVTQPGAGDEGADVTLVTDAALPDGAGTDIKTMSFATNSGDAYMYMEIDSIGIVGITNN